MTDRTATTRAPRSRRAPLMRIRRAALPLGAVLLCIAAAAAPVSAADGRTLPDNRAYELVTRYEHDGRDEGLNGVDTGFGIPSLTGEAIDWLGTGACCGASSAAETTYQSDRGPSGWQTRSLTPAPPRPLVGIFEEQAPVFWTSDLTQTIFSTPASYAPGDKRPVGSRADDLYLQGPTGQLSWVSQGPLGPATAPLSAKFDSATPDASKIVFSTQEPLTANATPLASVNTPAQYLYLRDVTHETTTLIDVDSNGELLGPYGASLGNGIDLAENQSPTSSEGTTTNALSADGTKVFFQTPPAAGPGLPSGVEPHLYMRDLANATTTPLDDPTASGSARYEGASADGALVFFTSNEGLDGASTAEELYVFNTTATSIGPIPPMASIPVAGGSGGFVGETATASDGSRVYFVATKALASNANSTGHTASAGAPNLYLYDTRTAETTFVTTLAAPDVNDCANTCGTGRPAGLVAPRDLTRPAFPTPGAGTLVFESTGDLTGAAHAPTTTLTAEISPGETRLAVASTAGFQANSTIAIDTGSAEEFDEVETVDSSTELTVREYSSSGLPGVFGAHPAGATVTQLTAEIYRYDTAGNSLTCVSCRPDGSTAVGSAVLGGGGGGTFAPPGQSIPMSEDASRIFFESPDALVPEAATAAPTPNGPTTVTYHAYEWENGHVSLISPPTASSFVDGTSLSGNDVFFATRAQVVPTGIGGYLNGYLNIYDARVNGGFPTPSAPPQPCTASDCRPQSGGATPFLATPPSASLLGAGNLSNPPAGGALFTVSKITRAQRARLQRTGQLTLTITAAASGTVTARALARLHGTTRRIAKAASTLRHGASITLTLRLNRAARSAIATGATIRIEVSYSRRSTVKAAEFSLPAQRHARAATEHRHA